ELREVDGHLLPRPDDAVGVGARGRDVVLHDLAGRGIETPDAVPCLFGEPDHPVRVLDRRVPARAIVRERILAEALGLRVEGGDLVATLLGQVEPSVRGPGDAVRASVGGGHRPLGELFRLRVEPPQLVGADFGEPDETIRGGDEAVGGAVGRRNVVFDDGRRPDEPADACRKEGDGPHDSVISADVLCLTSDVSTFPPARSSFLYPPRTTPRYRTASAQTHE